MEYEYKTYVLNADVSFFGGKFDSDSLDNVLNKFGKDGWELFKTVTPSKAHGETRAIIFIFRRQK